MDCSIEPLLQSYCSQKISEALLIDKRYATLWEEIERYLSAGGKRMRPRLLLFAYEAYGGKDIEHMLPIAAAWELLHSCLLVHDDIIDRDLVRHGHPNIAGRYTTIYEGLGHADASHYALSSALLAGDLLLMGAYELISTAALPSEQRLIAQSFLSKAIFAVAGGELIDTDAALYPLANSNPRSIAVFKTSSYSLQLPLQCGAALAGASPEELEKLSAIGLHAGIAYQLKDDLLGVFGDSAVTGKSNDSDIYEKKRTALVHQAIEHLPKEHADRLRQLYDSAAAISKADANEIKALLEISGAEAIINSTVKTESEQALAIITSLDTDTLHKDTLSGIVSKLAQRSH